MHLVVVKNPADFVGSVFGESEKNTKAILKATERKVLITDGTYMLYSGGAVTNTTSDPYKTAVVDTIVAEVQSTLGEDRCVLLLGYKEKLEEINFAGLRSNRERRGDLLVLKDQHSVMVDFSTGLDVLRDRIAIDIGVV